MSKLVDCFSKNTAEEVRTQLTEYHGHRLIDMRVYADSEGKAERVPTKKGLCISVDLFPELKAAVAKLEDAIVQAGYLDPEDINVS
ncbi:hypothetical protein GTO10_03640 [Candidatus Saccharibacteria bacterium]|nr:hypothetical protein [Candidatus Saccharibacteria bacterium]